MRVLLVTSDRVECGVREYGDQLVEAMGKIAAEVKFLSIPPDPVYPSAAGGTIVTTSAWAEPADLIHVNYHAALGSRWRPDHVKTLQDAGTPVVVTVHDTFERFDLMMDRGFTDFRGADALVIHEPVEGLMELPNVHYIRQGVPVRQDLPLPSGARRQTRGDGVDRVLVPAVPVVGSAGFPFPWKGFDALCRASCAAGWGVLLIVPGASVEQCLEWQRLNPDAEIIPQWLPRQEIVQRLSECQATAWLYSSGNSGTSGAIRLGIAARRPLIAYRNRQFRDLDSADLLWCETESGVAAILDYLDRHPGAGEKEAGTVAQVADRDSWQNAAKKYLDIYRSML